MISVLICSANPLLLEQVSKNITATIGTAFEILHFDNRQAKKGICAVYNFLAEKARFPYLCFVHEDVLFTENGWGQYFIRHFLSDPSVGIVGIAGSKYKSRHYSGWYSAVKTLDCGNIIHRDGSHDARNYFSPDDNFLPQQVICIDGVFMGCTREVWSKVKFDERIAGFHFYDLDFSLRGSRTGKVMVVYDISLVHITKGGDFGDAWIEGAFLFHNMHVGSLPQALPGLELRDVDEKIIRLWLDYLKNFRIRFANKMKWIKRQQLFLRPALFYPIMKFLVYNPLGLKHLHALVKKR